MPDVNPYSDKWPSKQNEEIWSHNPNRPLAKAESSQKRQGDVERYLAQSERRATKPGETDSNPSLARPPFEYYDNDETFAAFLDLSKDEMNRLKNLGRFILRNTRPEAYIDAEDALMEAAVRTMVLTRRWKRGVSRFNHLAAVMRSIVNQRLKQAARHVPLGDDIVCSQSRTLSAFDAEASVARLRAGLQGDVIALMVLESMMDEDRPRETQRLLGIGSDVYWAARKRIRRQADKLPGAAQFQRRPRPRPSLDGFGV